MLFRSATYAPFLQRSPIPHFESANLVLFALTFHRSTDSINPAEPENIETVESMLIDISTLRAATGGFAESNKLGEGGFGSVYKVLMTRHKLGAHTIQ